MSNVLDCRTYEQPSAIDTASFGADYIKAHDMNGIPYEDRETNVHVRAMCFCLLDWFFTCHTFTDDDGEEIGDGYQFVFVEPLADIAANISSAAETLQEYHADIPAVAIQEQIALCFQKLDAFREQIEAADIVQGMTWSLADEWAISKKEESIFKSKLFMSSMSITSSYQFFLSSERHEDFLQYALTAADDMFFGAESDVQLPEIEVSEQNFAMSSSLRDRDEEYVQPKSRGKSKSTKKRSRDASAAEQVDKPRKKQKIGKKRTTAASASSSKGKAREHDT